MPHRRAATDAAVLPVDKLQLLCYDAAKSSTPRLTISLQEKRDEKGAAKWLCTLW
jgi:hypothetical protein